MINKDSIVTAYDEHLTLVEWLQKVEKALNTSVLTNLGIAKLSDKDNVATYQVTATFADNTTIVSETFTLPSTDIVTAFSNLTTLVNGFDTRITTNTSNVASILNIIDIGNNKINASTLQNSINGSDDVIVDKTNDKLCIHLSPELQAKLARVLLKPSSAPSTRKVVTIDTNGAQDNVDPTELPTLMDNIVDSHGNKRFIEGNITPPTIEGATFNYTKWSLSGTHLMLVVAGSIDDTFSTGQLSFFTTTLPSYINNKIVRINENISVVSVSKMLILAPSYDKYEREAIMFKESTSLRVLLLPFSKSMTVGTKGFRLQFDLLIDSE